MGYGDGDAVVDGDGMPSGGVDGAVSSGPWQVFTGQYSSRTVALPLARAVNRKDWVPPGPPSTFFPPSP